jgi:hypothetical protein
MMHNAVLASGRGIIIQWRLFGHLFGRMTSQRTLERKGVRIVGEFTLVISKGVCLQFNSSKAVSMFCVDDDFYFCSAS